jgi:hypothetical protein
MPTKDAMTPLEIAREIRKTRDDIDGFAVVAILNAIAGRFYDHLTADGEEAGSELAALDNAIEHAERYANWDAETRAQEERELLPFSRRNQPLD